jgi:hypothetical protein
MLSQKHPVHGLAARIPVRGYSNAVATPLLSFRCEKEQELTRGGTTEVSPAMTPWRNSDPTKKSPASTEIAHAAKRCALLPVPPGVTRN